MEMKEPVDISVYINNEFKGSMTLLEDTAGSPAGRRYVLPDVTPSAGDKVAFKAEAEGYKTITAYTVIPDAPLLLSVDTVRYIINTWNEERIRLYVKMKDRKHNRNYYRIIVNRELEEKERQQQNRYSSEGYDYGYGSYYPGSDLWLSYEDPAFTSDLPLQTMGSSVRNEYGIFANNLFRGKEYVLKLSFTDMANYWDDDPLDLKIHYIVKLCAISESYYNYYKQSGNLSFAVGNIQLVPTKEYASSYTNVENGFGLVSSYNETRQEIIVN